MTVSNFVKVAMVSDIPQGQVRIFSTGEQTVALCNVEGNFYAVANVCTHDNGPLGEGELFNAQIECPRHGARFDVRTGKVLCLPAAIPVPTYLVEIRDEEIWVAIAPQGR